MLNKIWLAFFFIAFSSGVFQWLVNGDSLVFERIVGSVFSMSKITVEIAIGLVGALSFWLGVMKIAEKAGLVDKVSVALTPLFVRLMPGVPKNHPAIASMTMNLSANVLGLDNAATPMGIKAMKDLQTLNPEPEKATNAQILFLVLNTSSVTIFPIAVFVYRAQQGAVEPTDVFLPILLATSASSFAGLLAVAFVQKIKLTNFVVLLYLGSFVALIMGLIGYFATLTATQLSQQSSLLSNFLIFGFIVFCLAVAARKKLDVYDAFVDGAKEGFSLAISLIPYLLAMLVAIGVLRASGTLDILIDSIRFLVAALGGDTRFVDALPTALIKPLSGSGARAMMIETMSTHGADSFVGRIASTIQGSTETTFYVLAVYFGSVGIKHARHAIACGLIADVAGITAAIAVCYWFFG
ncbi:nucleoside recognition domain-containing protein [Flocculibacter collagenilyticus]|uniref:nucleoside recognition domain-containing protein n=1 Tax=Flocculibacter collagenilyticus TaxID=2744479 RepID=UPI0018F528CB|nr:spore maturation protein [Flocculibacter collagenilyticus]